MMHVSNETSVNPIPSGLSDLLVQKFHFVTPPPAGETAAGGVGAGTARSSCMREVHDGGHCDVQRPQNPDRHGVRKSK
eukprot:scaffold44183_cov30-Prasinocladus_malaysianus.AAC.2